MMIELVEIMKISAKLDYACRAVLELSLHWPNATPLGIKTIAKRQRIPMNFLVHILITLKQLGYVDSVRGKNGGYLLVKMPQAIKLNEIIQNFGSLDSPAIQQKKPKTYHVMEVIWSEVNQALLNALEHLNFEEIANRKRKQVKAITFEI